MNVLNNFLQKFYIRTAETFQGWSSFISSTSTKVNDLFTSTKPQIAIVGGGVAGYSAAIYAARAGLRPILYEGSYTDTSMPGGQLMSTTTVENYPGFPEGIEGETLIENLRKQALKFGTKILPEQVIDIDFTKRPFSVKGEKTHTQVPSVILATGATAKRLDIPGTRDGELWQRGVSACAVCDGALPLFRNKHVFVIGGGDSAMEEALFLSQFASKVSIVHRRGEFKASKVMQEAVLKNPKIEVLWNSVVTQVNGKDVVENVVIQNVKTGKSRQQEAAGVFFAVGHTPNTWFLKNKLKLDANGYIKVNPGTTQTSIPYVYAAGDVQDRRYRQAITAAGSGCMAALDAQKALSRLKT